MKISLIIITMGILSFSLFPNSYAEVGDFITSFDGTNGGTEFNYPIGIAVDSNDRIIVVDYNLNIVQIFDSNGSFVTSLNNGTVNSTAFSKPVPPVVEGSTFSYPIAVAVDSNDRIIVTDALNTIQIFDSNGSFVTSFGGVFVTLDAIAVDSNDRIIVTDGTLNTIQIFDSTGLFIVSLDGGTTFDNPIGVAVDSNDRIFVIDYGLNIVQIFNSTGSFLTSFDGTNGGTQFISSDAIAVDSNDRIIVTDSSLETVQIFEGFIISEPISASIPESTSKSNNGGCADCTAPTLGLNENYKRIVDNGFSYNNNTIQVDKWHTPFPLINATVGETNTVEIIIYENNGIRNLKLVQFGLGGGWIGQPLSTFEVLIEVPLIVSSSTNNIGIDKLTIHDKDNLIENSSVNATAHHTQCVDNGSSSCAKVIIQYSYREETFNHIMVVNVQDKPGNSQNFFFNEGVQVLGDSLNEPPTYKLFNKKTQQQTENIHLTLTRTDKINHIWTDEFGIEYKKISENWFDIITPREPYKCTDTPLDNINVPTRSNCHFRDLVSLWSY